MANANKESKRGVSVIHLGVVSKTGFLVLHWISMIATGMVFYGLLFLILDATLGCCIPQLRDASWKVRVPILLAAITFLMIKYVRISSPWLKYLQ